MPTSKEIKEVVEVLESLIGKAGNNHEIKKNLNTALKIVQKSIPEQPVRKLVYDKYLMYHWHCPCCNNALPIKFTNCDKCNQRLNWEGVR